MLNKLVNVAFLAAFIGAGIWGYRYVRYEASVDYSVDMGALEPVDALEWVMSPGEAAQLQVPTDGWYIRRKSVRDDRLVLSQPRLDVHVVLLVEEMGPRQKPIDAATVAERVLERMQARAESVSLVAHESRGSTSASESAHQLDMNVVLDGSEIHYRYRLFTKSRRVATLACFGPNDTRPDDESPCSTVFDSFSWST